MYNNKLSFFHQFKALFILNVFHRISVIWLFHSLFRHTKVIAIVKKERLADTSEPELAWLMFTWDSEGTEISVESGAKEIFTIPGAGSLDLGVVWSSIEKTMVSVLSEVWVSSLVSTSDSDASKGYLNVDVDSIVVESGGNSVVVCGMGEDMVCCSIGVSGLVSIADWAVGKGYLDVESRRNSAVKLDSFVLWIVGFVEVIESGTVIEVTLSVRIFVEAVGVDGWGDQMHW